MAPLSYYGSPEAAVGPQGAGLVPCPPPARAPVGPSSLAEPAQGRPCPAGTTVTCPVLTEALARGGPKGRAQATITGRVLSPLDPDTVLLRGRKPRKRNTHIRISCCRRPRPPPPRRRLPSVGRHPPWALGEAKSSEEPAGAARSHAARLPDGAAEPAQQILCLRPACGPRQPPWLWPGDCDGRHVLWRRSAAGRRWAEVDVCRGWAMRVVVSCGLILCFSHHPPPCRPNLKCCHRGRDSQCVQGTQGAAFLGGCSGVNGGPQKVVPVPNPSSCEATLLGEGVSAAVAGAWDEISLHLG